MVDFTLPIGEIDWNQEKYDISYVMKQKTAPVSHKIVYVKSR